MKFCYLEMEKTIVGAGLGATGISFGHVKLDIQQIFLIGFLKSEFRSSSSLDAPNTLSLTFIELEKGLSDWWISLNGREKEKKNKQSLLGGCNFRATLAQTVTKRVCIA